MKKYLFIMLAMVLPMIAFTACSSDDEEETNTTEIYKELIGVWQETFYWDRTDWHTWGWVSPPVWEFKSDKTYYYYDSMADYQNGNASSSGKWNLSEKYFSTEVHAREYHFSNDKQTFTMEKVAIMKRYTN